MRQKLKMTRNKGQTKVRRTPAWLRHPFAPAIGLFLALVLFGAGGLMVLSRKQAVTFRPNSSFIAIVSHNGQTQTVPTNERTVGSLLQKLDIRLGKLDRVEPTPNTQIEQDNLRINVYRAMPVTISDGVKTTTAYTAAATPRSIVTEAGVQMYPEDRAAAMPAENLLAEQSVGQRIVVQRSIPLTMTVYGQALPTRTTAKTVGELLKAKQVVANPKDTVLPAPSTPITAGMQVFVVRNGTQIVSETQSIPAPVQTVTDNSLSFGTTVVRQQGTPGTQILKYQVNTQKGVEVSRTLLQTIVTVPPVSQIVAKGQAVTIPADKQAVMAQAGIASSDYAYVDFIASHEGGWCPTKVQGSRDCPGYPPNPIPSYGGYGMFQATPGGKMASAGGDWATSAVTQIRWATGYAKGRYGSWAGAYNHWQVSRNW